MTLEAVESWGRLSAEQYSAAHPDLVAKNDPIESLMRLKVLRGTLFDFPAFDIPMLIDSLAHVVEREPSKFIEAVSGGRPKVISNLKSLLETGSTALQDPYPSSGG